MDTACTRSMVERGLVRKLGIKCSPISQVVGMINGESSVVREQCCLELWLSNRLVKLEVVVVEALVAGCDVLFGVDGIDELGGVSVFRGVARFHGDESGLCGGHMERARDYAVVASAMLKQTGTAGDVGEGREGGLTVEDRDFSAVFDGERWVVQWKWEREPPRLNNRCSGYRVPEGVRADFEAEVEVWIKEGILVPHDVDRHGKAAGLIPLMAVFQPNKNKVRPVLDYRELNQHIKSCPGADVDVCGEKLREWRQRGESVEMLDLRKAYLQLHVSEELQRYQTVQYKGRVYVLTRLGFGLASAPKMMTKVLGKILSLREDVRAGTDSYIDDIIVDTTVVSAATVRSHLANFGLAAKDPVPLPEARVLGLRVYAKDGKVELQWKRDNRLPEVEGALTKRKVFSICGQLVSHYPVASWLRVWCSYVKRLASGGEWDKEVPVGVGSTLGEVLDRVASEDPVHGSWCVTSEARGKVWCDASSLALGVCLELGGHVAEDASWLRKEGDCAHINVAELEAVLKGVNVGIRWGLKDMELVTDSATVAGWVGSVIRDAKRPKVSGLGEMLVKRRLGMLSELISGYELTLSISLVPSSQNKADVLTRVPKRWLKGVREEEVACAGVGEPHDSSIKAAVIRSHGRHHMGTKRTFFLAKKELGNGVTQAVVEDVVRGCDPCQKIDPAPVKWEKGSLDVEITWSRVAVDVTHYAGSPYLTMVDCGPSRFAVWKKLKYETGGEVSAHVESLFRERGVPCELVSDNGPCFRSHLFSELLSKWQVRHVQSCAYRASGNGIVERNHRTIKRMAARTGGDVRDMVMFYNASPGSKDTIPAEAVYMYSLVTPGVSHSGPEARTSSVCPFRVGDVVYVKPPGARCTTVWGQGTVTGVNSNVSVSVGNVPRHVRDLRKVPARSELSAGSFRDLSCVMHEGETESGESPTGSEFGFGSDSDEDNDDGSDGDGDNVSDGDVGNTSGERLSRPVRDRRPPGWLRNFERDF